MNNKKTDLSLISEDISKHIKHLKKKDLVKRRTILFYESEKFIRLKSSLFLKGDSKRTFDCSINEIKNELIKTGFFVNLIKGPVGVYSLEISWEPKEVRSCKSVSEESNYSINSVLNFIYS